MKWIVILFTVLVLLTACIFSNKTAVTEKAAAKAIPAFMGKSAVDEDTLYEFQSGNEFSAKGKLNPVLLDPKTSPLRFPGSRILFNMFADRQLIAIVDEVDPISTNHFLTTGHIEGVEDALFYLSYVNGALSGAIFAGGDGNFRLSQVGKDTYRAARMNNFDPPIMHVDSMGKPDNETFKRDNLIKRSVITQTNRTRYIDIAVYYDSSARTGAGSDAAMKAEIVALVDEMNVALKNSKLSVYYNLVDTQLVPYRSSNLLATDLGRLRSTTDSIMDTVHTLRDASGADLVGLITNTATDACGIAYLMGALSTSYKTNGFCVAQRGCTSPGQLTFAHEVGHLMGCHHDNAAAGGSPGIFAYSHGLIFTGKDNVGYKTILAYGNNTRIPYYSNPSLKYKGVAIGSKAIANNSSTINQSADYIELFNTRSNSEATVISPTAGSTVTKKAVTVTLTVTKETLVDSLIIHDVFSGVDKVAKVLRKKPWRATLGGLTEGSHKLYAVVVDKGRNRSSGDTVTFTLDITAGDAWDLGSIGEESSNDTLPLNGDTIQIASADGSSASGDQARYFYRSLPSNFRIAATVSHITGHSGYGQAGIMVRDSIDPLSPATFLSLGWDDSLRLGSRLTFGKSLATKPYRGSYQAPRRLMLVRRGSTLAAYQSDGSSFTFLSKVACSASQDVLGGLAFQSNDLSQRDTAFFTKIVFDSAANFPTTIAVTGITANAFYSVGDTLKLGATLTDLDGTASLRGIKVFASDATGLTLIGSDATKPYSLPMVMPAGAEKILIRAYDPLDSTEVSFSIRLK